jgi:hypothetical protein
VRGKGLTVGEEKPEREATGSHREHHPAMIHSVQLFVINSLCSDMRHETAIGHTHVCPYQVRMAPLNLYLQASSILRNDY